MNTMYSEMVPSSSNRLLGTHRATRFSISRWLKPEGLCSQAISTTTRKSAPWIGLAVLGLAAIGGLFMYVDISGHPKGRSITYDVSFLIVSLVFLAPAGNCSEVKGAVPGGLQVVKVTSLEASVHALDALRAGRQNLPSC